MKLLKGPKQKSISLLALALLISMGLYWRSEALDGEYSVVSNDNPQTTESDITSTTNADENVANSSNAPKPGTESSASNAQSGSSPVSSVPASNKPKIKYPSNILNLANWKLTLPINTAAAGNPDEIKQPKLATYQLNPYFYVNSEQNGVVFRAHAGGATTSNSGYPRSELREMTGSNKASWSNSNGKHIMTIRQAITKLPPAKPHVVAGQIHDGSDDVIQIRLEGKHLFVEGDGQDLGTLDNNYSLGKVFTVKVVAADSRIKVYYNGALKVNVSESGSGYYFKAGCYTQSNTSKGDAPKAYGEVIIYSLSVQHH